MKTESMYYVKYEASENVRQWSKIIFFLTGITKKNEED